MSARLVGLERTEGAVRLRWDDDVTAEVSIHELRSLCPCAHCISELTGQRLLDPATVPRDIALKDMQPVGRYAYRCLFSDQHDTGIYTLEMLREMSLKHRV